MTTDIALLSLADLSGLIRTRQLSPVELTQCYLDRIAGLDNQLHSFNSLRADAALAEAATAETAIQTGNWLGPLHGLPIGIKDLIDVAGLPTTAQSAHRRDHMARTDAEVVTALKRAGAIILGKQATAEYAVGGTQFDLPWPPARNPWNLECDPSSSSSGSAIAVAAGLCAGSVGTETAGSIRDPAAWCGVAGLKPTDRLVSTQGVLPLSRTMDCVGPLAWTVEDCALMLPGMVPEATLLDLSSLHDGIKGLRIGVVRHFYQDDPNLDPDVAASMHNALQVFAYLGATLSTVQLQPFALYAQTARAITWPEEYAEHGQELRDHPDRFGPVARSRLQDGKDVAAPTYINALRRRAEMIADLAEQMRHVDLLVLPAMLTPAQPLGYEFTPSGNFEVSLSRPFNLTGNPALSLCAGFTTAGLPLSIQIVGRHFEDGLVLRAGHSLERALALRTLRPPLTSHDPHSSN